MEEFISKSEQDTITFAKNFAKDLKNGDIIVLTGELGSLNKISNIISDYSFNVYNSYTVKKFGWSTFDGALTAFVKFIEKNR